MGIINKEIVKLKGRGLFSTKSNPGSIVPKLGNEMINTVHNLKVLGISFDPKLTYGNRIYVNHQGKQKAFENTESTNS